MSQQVPSIWQQLGQVSHQSAPKGSLRQCKLLFPTAVLQSLRREAVRNSVHPACGQGHSRWASLASLLSSFRAP